MFETSLSGFLELYFVVNYEKKKISFIMVEASLSSCFVVNCKIKIIPFIMVEASLSGCFVVNYEKNNIIYNG